jgi:hypothetical protein
MNNENEKQTKNVEGLKKKVHQSWYEDGLFEISFGICYLISSLVFLSPIIKFLPRSSNLSVVFLRLIVVSTIVAGTFLLIRKLKEKFVWSKAGYSVRRDYNPKMVLILAGVIFLFLAFYMLGLRFQSSKIATLFLGFVMFFVFIAQYIQAGKTKRFLLLSPIPLLIAVVSSLLGLTSGDSLFLMTYILGCTFLISGVIVYRDSSRKLTE